MSQQEYNLDQIVKVSRKLAEIFNTQKIEFWKRSEHKDRNFIYFANVQEINAEIQSKWSETFHNGSYYGISKGVKQDSLHLSFDITLDDLKKVGGIAN